MDKFDEYKFFAQSTQYLSDRRQAAAGTYLAINAAIVSVVAFLAKDAGVSGWSLALTGLVLIVLGLVACSIWQQTIIQYRDLIGWRFGQLIKLEKEIDGCYRMYTKEFDKFFAAGRRRLGFSNLERCLPWIFMALYLVAAAGVLMAAVGGAPPGMSTDCRS